VDWHRFFDADPDPTYYFEADPDPNPTPSFYKCRKIRIFYFFLFTAVPVYIALSFWSASEVSKLLNFWTAY
jgi:hypothetical protein